MLDSSSIPSAKAANVPDLSQLDAYKDANAAEPVDGMKNFVEQCMGEYDLRGWSAPDLANPSDINLLWPNMPN